MNLLKRLSTLTVCLVFTILTAQTTFAQHHKKGHPHPHHHPHKPHKPHPRSKYHPAKVVVYAPVWAHHKKYNRRWVYFPKHKCYWDNWRNVYVYKVDGNWTTSPNKPKTIEAVNLEDEAVELNDVEDDDDEIYKSLENEEKM
jgi:hypothetical protein